MSSSEVYAGVFFSAYEESNYGDKRNPIKPVERLLLERSDDSSGLVVPEEYFFIPVDNSYILYLPAIGAAFLVNEETKKLFFAISEKKRITLNSHALAVLNYFILNGIIAHAQIDNRTSREQIRKNELTEEFIRNYAPTEVILCPTTDCNLRCIYCYASGGDKVQYMDSQVAFKAIDYMIDNAIKSGKDIVVLGFHGGGEPTLAFDLIKKSIKYAKFKCRKTGINLELTLTTNLMVGKEQLKYIIDNFDTIGVSFDGPKDIQDIQRPAQNGKGSFDTVYANLKIMDKSKIKYSIRSTIMKKGVRRLEELTEFFFKNFPNVHALHVEPFFKVSRAEANALEAVSWEEFSEFFLKSEKLAKKYNKHLKTSCSGINTTAARYCGAVLGGFWVMLDGNVYSCAETLGCDDPIGHAFRIGRFDFVTEKLIIDFDKLRKLHKRDVDNIPHCKDCFAKYNCRGSCPAHVMRRTGDYMDTKGLDECGFIKEMVKRDLIVLLTKDKYRIDINDYLPLAEPEKLQESDIILEY